MKLLEEISNKSRNSGTPEATHPKDAFLLPQMAKKIIQMKIFEKSKINFPEKLSREFEKESSKKNLEKLPNHS